MPFKLPWLKRSCALLFSGAAPLSWWAAREHGGASKYEASASSLHKPDQPEGHRRRRGLNVQLARRPTVGDRQTHVLLVRAQSDARPGGGAAESRAAASRGAASREASRAASSRAAATPSGGGGRRQQQQRIDRAGGARCARHLRRVRDDTRLRGQLQEAADCAAPAARPVGPRSSAGRG